MTALSDAKSRYKVQKPVDEAQRPITLMLGSFFGRGVCRVRLNLCAGLIARGYKVDLMVINGKGEMRDDVPDGVRVIDLQAKRALNAIPKIAKYIKREKPIAIISAEDHLNFATLVARKLSGCSIPDDHISPRRSALFMARSVLREFRDGAPPC